MDRTLARILRCPQCSGALDWTAEQDRLACLTCPLTYPVRDGVPVLRIAEATVRPIATDPEFDRLVAEAVAAPFSGWDWSWLDGRRTATVDQPGDLMATYDQRARVLLAEASAVLDLGTGGGERLAQLGPFPHVAVATEAWPPNVAVAAERLGRLGLQVVHADQACHDSRGPQPGNRWPERRLPFADATFDLVLASRSAFCPREVARVLISGGALLTVQGGTEWRGETLAEALEGTPPEWTLPGHGWDVGKSFRQAGFRIVDWTERSATTTYRDVGAVVYVLLHLPWAIIDFDLDRYRERLYRLHQRMQREGGLTTRGYGYLIEARKP